MGLLIGLQWVGIALNFLLAGLFQIAALPWHRTALFALGILLILLGVALRWYAIWTLGRYFTRDVAVSAGQQVVEIGPYRTIRHPAYSGTFLTMLGVGLAVTNWASLLALLTCVLLGHLYRVRVEEMRASVEIVDQCLDRLERMDGEPWITDDRKVVLPPREELHTSMESLIHHFKIVTEGYRVPEGEVYVAVESPRGELGCYVVSDGGPRPWRVKFRAPSFVALEATATAVRESYVADMIAAWATRYVDIAAAVRIALSRAGVEKFHDTLLCTSASPEYFSYRRDGVTGITRAPVARCTVERRVRRGRACCGPWSTRR